MNFEKANASLRPKDQVKQDEVCLIAFRAVKLTIKRAAMNAVAAASERVACSTVHRQEI